MLCPMASIAAEEQVAERLAPEEREPPAPPVLLPIVQHVAPLTERHKIAGPVVGGVMIPVSGRENNAGGPDLRLEVLDVRHTPDLPRLCWIGRR